MFMSAIYMGAWDYTTSDRKLELIDFIGCFYNNMNNFSCLIHCLWQVICWIYFQEFSWKPVQPIGFHKTRKVKVALLVLRCLTFLDLCIWPTNVECFILKDLGLQKHDNCSQGSVLTVIFLFLTLHKLWC